MPVQTSAASIVAPRLFPRLRDASAHLLATLAHWLELHPAAAFTALLAVYLPASLAQSSAHLLWHDELFTLYIARARTLRALFADLRLIDLNPPLSYLLSRASLSAFTPGTLACRLPEIAAFAAAMLFLFCFVRRRAGVLFGLCSAALLLSSLAGELATDARPYALLLAFTSLGLLAWQRAREPRTQRNLTLFLLLLAAAGMLLSHVFGLLSWAALALGELARTVHRRRLDWPAALAFAAPLSVIGLYLPLLRSHGVAAFPPAFQPGGVDVFDFYIQHVDRELVVLLLAALLTAAILGRRRLRGRGTWLFSPPEWVSILALLATPAVIIAHLMLTHAAFFPRYGVVACISVALLATALLAFWTGGDPRSALLAAALALLISGQIASFVHGLPMLLSRDPFRASEPIPQPCYACILSASIDPSLPLVDASGLTFLEMDHRESPEALRRVFFLTDDAALEYAHATIFNGMELESRIFPIRAHVQDYISFLQQHPHFFVLGEFNYPEDWLLRKLLADGATLRLRGRVAGDYKDHELYEITSPPGAQNLPAHTASLDPHEIINQTSSNMTQSTAGATVTLSPFPRPLSQTLLIDADDTLWENNIYFERAIAAFISYLDHRVHTAEEVREHLNAIERSTVARHGYGLNSFRHSLVTCFEQLSAAPITPERHQRIVSFAKSIADQEIELLPSVALTMADLSSRHRLILVTKGDELEQLDKLSRSGLAHLFSAVEVLPEKHIDAYHSLLKRHGFEAASTWMIGNSPRSDINPALAAGLHAVFIPHDYTWVLEHDSIDQPRPGQTLLELSAFADLVQHF